MAAIEVNVGNTFEKREVENPAARKKCGAVVCLIEAVSGLLRSSVFENNGCLVVRGKINSSAAAPSTVVARKNKLAAGAVDLTKVDRTARCEIETPDILVGVAARYQQTVAGKTNECLAGNSGIARVVKRERRVKEVEPRARGEVSLVRAEREGAARKIDVDRAEAANFVREGLVPGPVNIDSGSAVRAENDRTRPERAGARDRENRVGIGAAYVNGSVVNRRSRRAGNDKVARSKQEIAAASKRARNARAPGRILGDFERVPLPKLKLAVRVEEADLVVARIDVLAACANLKFGRAAEVVGVRRELAENVRDARIAVERALRSVRERDVATCRNRQSARAAIGSELRVKGALFVERKRLAARDVDAREVVGNAEIGAAVAERKIEIVVPGRNLFGSRLDFLRGLTGADTREREVIKDRLIHHLAGLNERLEDVDAAFDKRGFSDRAEEVAVRAERIERDLGRPVVDELVDHKRGRAGRSRAVGIEAEAAELEARGLPVIDRDLIEGRNRRARRHFEDGAALENQVRVFESFGVVCTRTGAAHRHADLVERNGAVKVRAAAGKTELLIVRARKDKTPGTRKLFVDGDIGRTARSKAERQRTVKRNDGARAEHGVDIVGNGHAGVALKLPLALEVRVAVRNRNARVADDNRTGTQKLGPKRAGLSALDRQNGIGCAEVNLCRGADAGRIVESEIVP